MRRLKQSDATLREIGAKYRVTGTSVSGILARDERRILRALEERRENRIIAAYGGGVERTNRLGPSKQYKAFFGFEHVRYFATKSEALRELRGYARFYYPRLLNPDYMPVTQVVASREEAFKRMADEARAIDRSEIGKNW